MDLEDMKEQAPEKILALESVKWELMQMLKEIVQNKVNESTLNQLEYEYEQLSQIDLNSVDEIYAGNAERTLKLAKLVLQKYKERQDNERLVKSTVYITPSQIHHLDDIADEQSFKGKGRRSQALRFVLNKFFE